MPSTASCMLTDSRATSSSCDSSPNSLMVIFRRERNKKDFVGREKRSVALLMVELQLAGERSRSCDGGHLW